MLEDYVYDMQGHNVSAHNGSTVLRNELYDADGRHLATYSSSAVVYNLADNLGTERVRASSSGATVEFCTDTPYGMNMTCSGADSSPMHYTGLQLDPESNMSHALNRELNMNLGRWITADPAGKGPVKLDDPQTWNLYAYVRNDPMTLTDPSGLAPDQQGPDSTSCTDKQGCNDKSAGPPMSAQARDVEAPPQPIPTPLPPAPHIEYQQSAGSTDVKIGTAEIVDLGTGYSGHNDGLNNSKNEYVKEDSKDPKHDNAGPAPHGKYEMAK